VQQHDAEVVAENRKDNYFVALVSIVWKQFVLHVVLWLLGLYLTSLNLPQIFLTGWKMCIQQPICDPTISALIKHAWSFELLSAMALGIFGKRHLAL
jgi:hypothetical protein